MGGRAGSVGCRGVRTVYRLLYYAPGSLLGVASS